MKKLLTYLVVVIVFISCSKEDEPVELTLQEVFGVESCEQLSYLNDSSELFLVDMTNDSTEVTPPIVQPEFKGGIEEMMNFFNSNLEYPRPALVLGIEGLVVVTFIIGKNGGVYCPEIKRSVGYGMDVEVLRVINLMPDWNPGYYNDEPVNVRFNLPVRFELR